jgi:hypothetical protein
VILHSLLALLFSAQVSNAIPPQTIDLEVVRDFPKEVEAPLARKETVSLPFEAKGCNNTFELASLRYTLSVIPTEDSIVLQVCLRTDVQKKVAENLSAPRLTIHYAVDGKETAKTFPFEASFASLSWETASTFSECLDVREMPDPSFWRRAELVCGSESPFTSPLIPTGVVYKTADDQSRKNAAAALRKLTSGGFREVALYGEPTILGPNLWQTLKNDSAVTAIEGPSIVFIDPQTNATRHGRRIAGEDQRKQLNDALRTLFGGKAIRIRAATSRELSVYWGVIPFDIEEPVVVIDDGTYALLFDFSEDGIFFIEDVSTRQ